MIRQLVRWIAPGTIAIGVLWLTPIGVGTARADNLGGKFERCAQLVEFVAPTAADPGHLTLVGIGPGLYNDISDTTTHRFPFSPGLVISDTLRSQLQALANGRRFTCLRMEGDGMGIVTQIAIHDGTRQCGSVSRDADGTYALDDEPNFLHVELIAEAKKIIESDSVLRRYLGMQERSTTCLVFGLAANGIARSIRLDGAFEKCGTLSRDGSVLRVGGVPLADSGNSTAALLSTRTARAGFLLATRDTNGCGIVELKSSRIRTARLTADGSVCGPVRNAKGKTQIGADTIPNILGDAQTADLRAAIGGSACLTVAIVENAVTTGLRTTPAPPPSPTPTVAPTPSATPSPAPTATPSPTASPTPSATQAPVVPAVVDETPTGSTGYPAGPLFLGLLAVMAVVVVGFVGLRRSRTGTVLPEPSSSAALIAEPTVDTVETQAHPTVVSLTRREQEVLAMLFDGMSNKEIGSRLFISESTAGVHVSNIMAKLGARSRAEAATLALRMHLLTNDTFEH